MQFRKRIRHLFQPKALVLMYHRIAELKIDPWQLAVSPENFEQHLKVLQKTGKLISVEKMVSLLRKKQVENNSICLTFDDGYTDNFTKAKPLLEKYQCAATFFIPTYYTGSEQQFWWDELQDIFLSYPVLPALFSLQIKDKLFDFDLGKDSVLTDELYKAHESWAWPASPPSRRCKLYLDIWEQIRPLPFSELQSAMDSIKSWASFQKPFDTESFPMATIELKELATHPLIDPGLHTSTHPALSFHNREEQRYEISSNKNALEGLYKRTIETIAYPYGNYNDSTLAVVKELNLSGAFTTSEKIVSNLTDPLQIGRFQVRNSNGNDFEKWLLNLKRSPQFL